MAAAAQWEAKGERKKSWPFPFLLLIGQMSESNSDRGNPSSSPPMIKAGGRPPYPLATLPTSRLIKTDIRRSVTSEKEERRGKFFDHQFREVGKEGSPPLSSVHGYCLSQKEGQKKIENSNHAKCITVMY